MRLHYKYWLVALTQHNFSKYFVSLSCSMLLEPRLSVLSSPSDLGFLLEGSELFSIVGLTDLIPSAVGPTKLCRRPRCNLPPVYLLSPLSIITGFCSNLIDTVRSQIGDYRFCRQSCGAHLKSPFHLRFCSLITLLSLLRLRLKDF